MQIGSATAVSGSVGRGWFEVTELPTGGRERLPVLIARGEAPGPTLWVTAGLHGNEVTGIAVAQNLMTDDLASRIRGTVVCIPVLNPAGVRRGVRTSYYHEEDPNRYFPFDTEPDPHPPLVQQLIDERIFARFRDTADALVSLHSAWVNERTFTIVERVRYGARRTREQAQTLARETQELVKAFGLPPVREFDVPVQDSYDLHRSFECTALNAAGVPTITPELGSPRVVEDENSALALHGLRNVLRTMGMLPGEPTPHENAPTLPVDYPVKRVVGPVADTAGLVRHHVDAGDVVESSDPVADIVSTRGEVKSTVESTDTGYVLGRREGIAVYENDPLLSFAARDDGPVIHHEQ